MSVVNGSLANQTTFNNAFLSRTTDSDTIGKVDLENTLPESGDDVINTQREINSLNAYTGRPRLSAHDATPVWTSNELGTSTDTLKDRVEAIDSQFADLSPYIVDASVTERGLVSTVAQSFAGDKTFTGTIGASNLSGTNTGDITLGAVGVTPNANGATLTGQALNLEPASSTFAGIVTAIGQTFGGIKTFADGIVSQVSIIISGVLNLDTTTDSVTTGSLQTLATPTKTIVRVTDSGLVSIEGVTAPTTKQQFVLMNVTGVDIDLVHLSGTAANQIHTGTGSDLTMSNGQAVTLIYDLDSTVWRVVGGGGSGGGSGNATPYLEDFTGTTVAADIGAATLQVFSYTGGSAQSLTSLATGFLPIGGRIMITGTSDTNTLTIQASALTNVVMNGDIVLYQHSSIEFTRMPSGFIVETSRNGI